MSTFHEDIAREIEVRVAQYKSERAALEKAAARIAELDALIAAAEAEDTRFRDLHKIQRVSRDLSAPVVP